MPELRRTVPKRTSAEAELIVVAGHEIAVSNPTKVLFPKPKYTKLDLVRYYLAVPGVKWPQVLAVAEVVRTTLHEFGLTGWPKTSGSRGMHVLVRIERRWTFDEVRRAALALARDVERRAPTLATSKWWKEERHGV